MATGPRIILIGGTYRALCVLERLLERGERVVGFIGQEGGGERDFCPEILEACDRHSIPARSAHKLGEEVVRWLEDRIRPDLAIAVGTDLEIPVAVGGNARLGLIELIDSLRSESCPGVTLRQRGQDLVEREIKRPSENDAAGDAYLAMLDALLEVLESYLDRVATSFHPPHPAIPYQRDAIGPEAVERIAARPAPGPHTAGLERDVATYLDAECCVALESRTHAFSLILDALGLEPGDEIVCPGVMSRTALEAVRTSGATPVFCDVERRILTLDPERARERVGPRTRALLIAHAFGQPAALDELYAVAADAGIEVIEDAGSALGARFDASRIGRAPCTCVFGVPLSGVEGALATLAPGLAERIVDRAAPARLGDGAASLAREALARLEAELSARRRVAEVYSSELVRYDAFRVPLTPEGRLPTYAGYVLGVTRFSRTGADDLHKLLGEAGISTRRPAFPIPERELPDLPGCEEARASSLLLPAHSGLTDSDLDSILDAIFGYAIG